MRHPLGTGLPIVQNRFVPDFAPQGMVRQPIDLFGQTIRIVLLQGCNDLCMQGSPPLMQQATIGNLVGQRMFEGVDLFRVETGLVEKLGSLQMGQVTAKCFFGYIGNRLLQREGYFIAYHRSRLHKTFLVLRKPINTG
jgi:hypothetical protein